MVKTETKAPSSKHTSRKKDTFFRDEGQLTSEMQQGQQSFFSPYSLQQAGNPQLPFFNLTTVQTKLKIGRPGDKYEQEADRMADKVVQKLANPGPVKEDKDENSTIRTKTEKESIQCKPAFESDITTHEPMIQRKAEAVQNVPVIQKKESAEEETIQEKNEEETEAKNLQRKPVFGSDVPSDLQAKAEPSQTSVKENLESRLNRTMGQGQPLDKNTRLQMEEGFGTGFSNVRIHTGSESIQMNKDLNSQAFTHGLDIYFSHGKYDTGSGGGKQLLAHELTHVLQQSGNTEITTSRQISNYCIQQTALTTPNIEKLRKSLREDNEEGAISIMKFLTNEEKDAVINSREFKELAIKTFGNNGMYQAMIAMGRNLYKSLEWMFDEGTDWESVATIIRLIPSARDTIRTDNWMKEQFVKICNDEEMSEAVDLLGGTLIQKLRWMMEEGSNWDLVKAKLQSTADLNEKTALYGDNELKSFFVDVCNDVTMAEVVDLLGGTLIQKLRWMMEEGSNWNLVKTKIQKTADKNEKTTLYGDNEMRSFLVDVCNDVTMAEAVDLLSGTLIQKLRWMMEEGSKWNLVKAKLQNTADPIQKIALYGDNEMRSFFVNVCDDAEMAQALKLIGGTLSKKLLWLIAEDTAPECFYEIIRESPSVELTLVSNDVRNQIKKVLNISAYNRIIQMLDSGLLRWGEVDRNYRQEIYENTSTAWELQSYTGHESYDIECTRSKLRIIVRIELTGEPAPLALRSVWINGIQNRWNGKFHIEGPKRLDIVFDIQFIDDDPHHKLEIHNNPGMREDAGNWDLNTSGDTAAHEFGHWVGNEDEYRRTAVDFQRVVGRAPAPAEQDVSGGYSHGTEMIMRFGGGDAKIRHFQNFLIWLNNNRNPGEMPYSLVAGP